jgi:hypothetical protein
MSSPSRCDPDSQVNSEIQKDAKRVVGKPLIMTLNAATMQKNLTLSNTASNQQTKMIETLVKSVKEIQSTLNDLKGDVKKVVTRLDTLESQYIAFPCKLDSSNEMNQSDFVRMRFIKQLVLDVVSDIGRAKECEAVGAPTFSAISQFSGNNISPLVGIPMNFVQPPPQMPSRPSSADRPSTPREFSFLNAMPQGSGSFSTHTSISSPMLHQEAGVGPHQSNMSVSQRVHTNNGTAAATSQNPDSFHHEYPPFGMWHVDLTQEQCILRAVGFQTEGDATGFATTLDHSGHSRVIDVSLIPQLGIFEARVSVPCSLACQFLQRPSPILHAQTQVIWLHGDFSAQTWLTKEFRSCTIEVKFINKRGAAAFDLIRNIKGLPQVRLMIQCGDISACHKASTILWVTFRNASEAKIGRELVHGYKVNPKYALLAVFKYPHDTCCTICSGSHSWKSHHELKTKAKSKKAAAKSKSISPKPAAPPVSKRKAQQENQQLKKNASDRSLPAPKRSRGN